MTVGIRQRLEHAGDHTATLTQAQKKNYAEILSCELAQAFADRLRPTFTGILPDSHGGGQESRARSSKGYKKLDVNYSTVQLGLGLGVSIKTINFRDANTRRYTKNYTRVDGELRAEASDYHERQPYATMVAVIFLPADAAEDAGRVEPSSFGAAARLFRRRAGRLSPKDSPVLFQRLFIGLYDTTPASFGAVEFVDVLDPPPKRGRSRRAIGFEALIGEIVSTYDARNDPPFIWDDGTVETPIPPDAEDADSDMDL